MKHPAAVHRRLRSGRRRREAWPEREAIQSRRPRVGFEPGLLGRQGTFAEYAAVDEGWLYPTPEGVSDETAAACALVGLTAHFGLVRDAKLQAGETLFVNGGTGGVGSMVVQMSKAHRCASHHHRRQRREARRLPRAGGGCGDQLQDRRRRGPHQRARAGGVNVWWETLREPNFDQAVAAAGPRGRMILMAGRDARPVFPVGPFYVKGCHLLRLRHVQRHARRTPAAADDINRWLAAGKLKPRIDRVLPLEPNRHRPPPARRKHQSARAGPLAGKIVINHELATQRTQRAQRKLFIAKCDNVPIKNESSKTSPIRCGRSTSNALDTPTSVFHVRLLVSSVTSVAKKPTTMLPRILEPEVMDTADDAREYDAMDHAAVNHAFRHRFTCRD